VLVTAYVNYALDGYKVKASRFLLKDDLEQTLPECVEDILREERVVEFGFVEGTVRLRVDDIIYIETSKHKNVFYTKGQEFSIYRKMDDLEEDFSSGSYNPLIGRFRLDSGTLTEEAKETLALSLDHSIRLMAAAYELWDFGVLSPIIRAAVYEGLFLVGRAVFEGTFKAGDAGFRMAARNKEQL